MSLFIITMKIFPDTWVIVDSLSFLFNDFDIITSMRLVLVSFTSDFFPLPLETRLVVQSIRLEDGRARREYAS